MADISLALRADTSYDNNHEPINKYHSFFSYGPRNKVTESTQMVFFNDDSGQRCSCEFESHADTTQFVQIRTVSVASRRLRAPVIAAAG